MSARGDMMIGDASPPALAAAGPTGARALLEAMRPRQWLKNVFVLAGVCLRGQALRAGRGGARAGRVRALLPRLQRRLPGQRLRRPRERAHHPTKRGAAHRLGRLSPQAALLAAAALAAAAVLGSLAVSRGFFFAVLGYLALTAAYNARLKRVFLVDAIVVAAGFVIRAAAGAAAIDALISPWLLSCTFQLALFLALGKRRHELTLLGETAGTHRQALSQYTVALLDSWLTALTGATIVAYALYTQAPRTVEHFGTTT